MTKGKNDTRPVSVLLLEDSRHDAALIIEHVQMLDRPMEIVRAYGRPGYLRALADNRHDIILSDYSLPGFDGLAALDIAREKAPDTPFIFVSGVLGEEIAIDSFKKGAADYVLKQRLIRLPSAIERALAEARERRERRHAEEQMELLVAELSHRVKNTLATVISIVRQTAKNAADPQQYRDTLLGRLQALSEAHSLIFGANWRESYLEELLTRTLAPYRQGDDKKIVLSGPQVKLDPKAALALSMVFHELSTNAAKYGALSDGGKVSVTWDFDKSAADDGRNRITLSWRESGGPPVKAPSRSGFGTTLLQRSIEYELDGTTAFSYPEPGFVCELTFAPLSPERGF